MALPVTIAANALPVTLVDANGNSQTATVLATEIAASPTALATLAAALGTGIAGLAFVKTAANIYNALPTDCIILCDYTGSDQQIILPTVGISPGKLYAVK